VLPVARDLQLTPDYWLAKLTLKDKAIPSRFVPRDGWTSSNQTLFSLSESMCSGKAVADSIKQLSRLPNYPLYNDHGACVEQTQLESIRRNSAIDTLPDQLARRYALVIKRADLRRFPDAHPVYSRADEALIDRFQESALFPGDPVCILHHSRDRAWCYVASPNYTAWISKTRLAIGSSAQVRNYIRRRPVRVITGSTVHTVYTPLRPALSQLQLDMGVRLPLRLDWPLLAPVNGQLGVSSWIVNFPVKNSAGRLGFAPVLLPRSADTAADYLPLSATHVIRQAFKFLGERYGWGHRFNARDCSGFVGEIYRSMGITLPRNTGEQAQCPHLASVYWPVSKNLRARLAALRALRVGDLVYIPGHVMLVIGHDRGLTWVIHDIARATYRDSKGRFTQAAFNGVVVTPLERLYLDADTRYVERITAIKRVIPE